MMEDDLNELMIDTYQDSGILEERKCAWWKTILAMPEKTAKANMVTKEPSSAHLDIQKGGQLQSLIICKMQTSLYMRTYCSIFLK